MDSKKLKYSLIILAIGLLTGFALTFWLVPDNPYIPGNDKAGLETGELDAKYKYNIEEYKKVDPKLVLYGEYAAENHGGNSVDECGMNNKLNSIRRNSGRKSAEVHFLACSRRSAVYYPAFQGGRLNKQGTNCKPRS